MIGLDAAFAIGDAMPRQWTVDAFATAPFRGNPACVVEPFEAWPTAAWMQALAAENAQAETAYLLATEDPARYGLRWFTPTLEAPLCGHATLAAAHVLFADLGAKVDELRFETQSAGVLRVREAARGYVMDFPADPPRRVEGSEALTRALGVEPLEVWAGQYLVAVLADEATVRGLRPDIAALARVGDEASGGPGNVVVVAPADGGAGYDVVDRFFAPGSGIAEDPTTGSAHCLLTPLYEPRIGHSPVRFHQAYPGRGGDLICAVQGDRVRLEGEAVTVVESRLRLRPA